MNDRRTTLRGQHILVVSPEPWEGLQLSKHDLARALVERGNEVVFWGPPEAGRRRVELVDQGALRQVRYGHWLRGLNRLPRALHERFYGHLISRIERLSGRPFEVIWCFDVTRLQWFPRHRAMKVLHLADHDVLQSHKGSGLASTADAVFTVTTPLRKEILRMAPGASVHAVGHLVEDRWLQGIDTGPKASPVRTVAYAGQLATGYIDWEVLHAVITRHSGIAFEFYGPYDLEWPAQKLREVLQLPNVRLHGLVERGRLIPALRAADVLLLCYRADQLKHIVANSHKMLEYLATGNPVVCSHTEEYSTHRDLLAMAIDRWDFTDLFERTVRDFAINETEERRKARVDLARQRSAPVMLERMAQLIAEP